MKNDYFVLKKQFILRNLIEMLLNFQNFPDLNTQICYLQTNQSTAELSWATVPLRRNNRSPRKMVNRTTLPKKPIIHKPIKKKSRISTQIKTSKEMISSILSKINGMVEVNLIKNMIKGRREWRKMGKNPIPFSATFTPPDHSPSRFLQGKSKRICKIWREKKSSIIKLMPIKTWQISSREPQN